MVLKYLAARQLHYTNFIDNFQCIIGIKVSNFKIKKFQITTNCSADKRCYNSTASLLSSSSQTTEAEKIYPNAEEYFKNRIISFMRTTIVGLLKNKLESDLSQELTQFKRIKLQKTNIECTEVYPRHFEILRQDVWKIDSKVMDNPLFCLGHL